MTNLQHIRLDSDLTNHAASSLMLVLVHLEHINLSQRQYKCIADAHAALCAIHARLHPTVMANIAAETL